MRKRQPGFTLIELMIAVAAVGILAAIAFPSYQGAVRKSNRGAAQAFMMEVAQREQARFLDSRSYVAVANNGEFDDADKLRMPVPGYHPVTPRDIAALYDFSVTLVAGPPPGFTITAVAKGSQLADKNLVLTNTGTKTRDGDASKW